MAKVTDRWPAGFALAIIVATALCLRLALAPAYAYLPNDYLDERFWTSWMFAIHDHGILNIFRTSEANYVGYQWVLWLLSIIYDAIGGAYRAGDTRLHLLVKAPSIARRRRVDRGRVPRHRRPRGAIAGLNASAARCEARARRPPGAPRAGRGGGHRIPAGGPVRQRHLGPDRRRDQRRHARLDAAARARQHHRRMGGLGARHVREAAAGDDPARARVLHAAERTACARCSGAAARQR